MGVLELVISGPFNPNHSEIYKIRQKSALSIPFWLTSQGSWPCPSLGSASKSLCPPFSRSRRCPRDADWASPCLRLDLNRSDPFPFPPRPDLSFSALNSCSLLWHISEAAEKSLPEALGSFSIRGFDKYLLYDGKQGRTLKTWNVCQQWPRQFSSEESCRTNSVISFSTHR